MLYDRCIIGGIVNFGFLNGGIFSPGAYFSVTVLNKTSNCVRFKALNAELFGLDLQAQLIRCLSCVDSLSGEFRERTVLLKLLRTENSSKLKELRALESGLDEKVKVEI